MQSLPVRRLCGIEAKRRLGASVSVGSSQHGALALLVATSRRHDV